MDPPKRTTAQKIVKEKLAVFTFDGAINEPSFRSQNTETQFYISSRSPAEISTDQNFELTERQTNRNMQQGPQAKFEPFQIQLKSAAGGSQSKWQNWGDWSICRTWFSIVEKKE